MTRPTRQLTIRLDADLARAIADEARVASTSLNRAALTLLRKGAGLQGTDRPIGSGLDRYFGTWTQEEAAEFDAIIKSMDQIDWELWGKQPVRRRRK